eukprot:m.66451 g.66451  ORF g.66451 m.66451 type:complete len:480 (+) comp9818_c0_seq1:844-2283(+)
MVYRGPITLAVLLGLTRGVAGLRWLPEHARSGAIAAGSPDLLPPTYPSTSVLKTLDVPLDHSNPNGRTFPLRYFVDDSCWDAKDGPIFVEMGGEGPASGARCGSLHKTHSALAVAVEHRFYGGSIPFNDRTVANLKYLSVEQNLADTAAVIEAIQKNLTSKRVVMNFGGSYSGATAAWFRIAYPEVTHGTSSSSGVVNAILNFTEFDQLVAAAIDRPKAGCAARLRAVTAAFERAFAAGEAQKNAAKEAMGAKNLVGTTMGDADFWYMQADGAAMMDQYGHKAQLCDALEIPYTKHQPTDADLIANFGATIKKFWGDDFGASCFYDSECLKDTSRVDMARSWRWQKCTELAYLQPGYSGSLRHAALSLDQLVEQCVYVFGEDAVPPNCGTEKTNARYGGATGITATKIVFLDYSDDPWQMASVRKQLSPSLPYCFTECDGCGHCGAGVPPTVTKCADIEAKYIGEWVAEAKAELRKAQV